MQQGSHLDTPRESPWAVIAVVAVWVALIVPADLRDVVPALLLQLPGEFLILLVVALLVRAAWVRRVAGVLGGLIGLVFLVEVTDLGFDAVFDRPFDPVGDWTYLGSGIEVLRYEYGDLGTAALVGLGIVVATGCVVGLVWATRRLFGLVRSHRGRSRVALVVLTSIWLVAASVEVAATPRLPVAAHNALQRVVQKVAYSRAALADRAVFDAEVAADAFAARPSSALLTGLRGKDVVVVFVESYGRVALDDPGLAALVEPALAEGATELAAAGFAARSGFLTSPTYGAASWLAHATLQSGLRVDSQHRYNRLLQADRLTLTSAFAEAGWRTVNYAPAITKPWPEGQRFYGFDELVRRADLGYAGPAFGFDSVPDQYTLGTLGRRELASAGERPVMAQVSLISSHHPWTPIPSLLDWDLLGNGKNFDAQPGAAGPQALVRGSSATRTAYSRSVAYSLSAVLSFVARFGGEDLVVLLVGDHQPHSYISGTRAERSVPVSLIARDRAVLDRIDDWGWSAGVEPAPDAPVWPMEAFRDRLLTAFAD